MRVRDDPDVEVRRIGEGFGLASVVARVDLIRGADVASYVCKLCDADAADREIAAYRDVLSATPGVPCPTFVTGVSDADHGVVVTRFVAGRQGDVLVGCDHSNTTTLMRAVARLHGRWWQQPPPGVPRWPTRPPTPLTASDVRTVADRFGDVVSTELLEAATDRAVLEHAMAVLDDRPTTVLHTDLHLDNVLITDAGPVLLDWAGLRCGPVEVDLARCFVEFVDPPIDEYRAELARYDVEPPADLDAAIGAVLHLLLVGMARWSAGDQLEHESRPWQLARHGMRRLDTLLG